MALLRTETAQSGVRREGANPSPALLGLSALGVVFGDIGTSPLYAFKMALAMSGERAFTSEMVLGLLSLIFWSLLLIASVKYVILAIGIDNNGEGGVLALMSLIGIKKGMRPTIVTMGLLGAAFIYGDGAVTPAISVLSAVEGLSLPLPATAPFILAMAVAILAVLFLLQHQGTSRIGKFFGPIMFLWFISIAALGAHGVLRHPSVVVAFNPLLGLRYLFSHGYSGFLVLGGVFLCITGAEALYADLGQFGPRSIRYTWCCVVFPSLLLNYAGQSAIMLEGAPAGGNTFFRLCPDTLLLPVIFLATAATIIASQSIITGAFSMTRQAIQLDYLPRLRITQTSEGGYGQIYIGAVNWVLMCATIGLAIFFGKSDNLAGAYGIAVSATMLITSALLFVAMRDVLGWSLLRASALAGLFLCLDASFFVANLAKIVSGGYAPLLIAGIAYALMAIWHRGSAAVDQDLEDRLVSIGPFTGMLNSPDISRVRGAAVFLTRTSSGAPPFLVWFVKHNRSLHRHVLVLRIVTEPVPRVEASERLQLIELAPNFWRATAHYGFMERPDIPLLTVHAYALGCGVDPNDAIYYVGHETIVRREEGKRLPGWQHAIFAFMERNSAHAPDYFRLPSDKVVEVGQYVAI